ncbi:DUF1579 family protein [Novipirellula artificiosorum]|uniref:THAP4-like heme-binding beta-barrel domain-containing protein n=1 Tax=Novipirellula artificiosorum TaxID=2528016 RepID=A0A5C6DF42_9BACT|nr:DUF1579 family protein [Novipirellula artificiosorum]TWU34845.1 hypothetical protein Poly41_39880 [Novipirellula artificiosorum]
MRQIVAALTVVLLTCGVTYGQDESGPGFEHLKSYGPMIGTWQYDGPSLQDVPGIAKKGTKVVFEFSWKWILDKSVVEETWSFGVKGGKTFSGKGLIGWNAAEKKVTFGTMDSFGGMVLGSSVYDAETKSRTYASNGIDGDGNKISSKGVLAKVDKDTLTFQALEQTGGSVFEGPSPIYTFKRVQRTEKEAK